VLASGSRIQGPGRLVLLCGCSTETDHAWRRFSTLGLVRRRSVADTQWMPAYTAAQMVSTHTRSVASSATRSAQMATGDRSSVSSWVTRSRSLPASAKQCGRGRQRCFSARRSASAGLVVRPAAVGRHLAHDCGRVTPDPPGNHRPRHGAILDQRDADLLTFGQRQRRTWHASVSIGRCRSEAPAIMTGTVHRLLGLAVDDRNLQELLRQREPLEVAHDRAAVA